MKVQNRIVLMIKIKIQTPIRERNDFSQRTEYQKVMNRMKLPSTTKIRKFNKIKWKIQSAKDRC
jgi:hypothetical protein